MKKLFEDVYLNNDLEFSRPREIKLGHYYEASVPQLIDTSHPVYNLKMFKSKSFPEFPFAKEAITFLREDKRNKKLVGVMDTVRLDVPHLSKPLAINFSEGARDHKGFYDHIVNTVVDKLGHTLISDESQTPEASMAWQSLIKKGRTVHILDVNYKPTGEIINSQNIGKMFKTAWGNSKTLLAFMPRK